MYAPVVKGLTRSLVYSWRVTPASFQYENLAGSYNIKHLSPLLSPQVLDVLESSFLRGFFDLQNIRFPPAPYEHEVSNFNLSLISLECVLYEYREKEHPYGYCHNGCSFFVYIHFSITCLAYAVSISKS